MKRIVTISLVCLIILGNVDAQNVGIGTTTPFTRLHIKQNLANRAFEWEHESQIDNWSLGIGTNTLNARFEFDGVLRAQISSTDGAYVQGSDLRYKEEIEPISDLMTKTMQLKPFTYFYKDTHKIAKNKSMGFIAQDVQKIFPELVYEIDGGYQGINYAGFGIIAIKVIQEQQHKIDNLEERLAKLEKGEK